MNLIAERYSDDRCCFSFWVVIFLDKEVKCSDLYTHEFLGVSDAALVSFFVLPPGNLYFKVCSCSLFFRLPPFSICIVSIPFPNSMSACGYNTFACFQKPALCHDGMGSDFREESELNHAK